MQSIPRCQCWQWCHGTRKSFFLTARPTFKQSCCSPTARHLNGERSRYRSASGIKMPQRRAHNMLQRSLRGTASLDSHARYSRHLVNELYAKICRPLLSCHDAFRVPIAHQHESVKMLLEKPKRLLTFAY
jgi:CO dehydrogenase/acetyl-CoA synthase alpha subunit